MSAYLEWFSLGYDTHQCLACGSTMLSYDPEATMCSMRYTPPHGSGYMKLVAEELDLMGALENGHTITREEHQYALSKARARYARA